MLLGPRFALITLLLALGVAVAAGCTGTPGESETDIELAPASALPTPIREAPVPVRDAYRFAVANTAILRQVPCHCGCGPMGHTSNASCYLQGDSTSDVPVFDSHALGCSICIDITQDVMRLMRRGKPLSDIQAYVESTYSRYGPSNLP